ncbi:alpha/beta fold hydrolase [uncultured Brevundimonas sp.]|uniref:alpha/beta fold hydrolase n=1 Tax=uncultured Brevundimonas sp. TaxID=213418 RepID=UPI0030EB6A56
MRTATGWMAGAALALWAGLALAQTPAPVEGDYVRHDFRLESGAVLPELKIHYRTLGAPVRDADGRITNAVMILHGTGGTGAQFLVPQFADELYGPGQPLDVTRYYVILPDNLGHGDSSKPSDGLRAAFPEYDYADMVEAQRRMLVEGLGVDHLRLIFGTSMGCMHIFVWGETHPDFADALMPMACEPTAITGRNRLWRAMLLDSIRSDPAWQGGNYVEQPQHGLRTAVDLLLLAGSAPMPMQRDLATREIADGWLAAQQDRRIPALDANDLWYQVNASWNYDPSVDLEQITAPLTWINSADDFINPPELGLSEQYAPRIRNGRYRLIPNSIDGHGHGTHTWAVFWKADLVELLARSGG